jgi:plasmid stabilization system protein ParE
MMRLVNFSSAALDDLDEALDWYGAHAPGIRPDLIVEVRAAVERIAANPKQFPVLLQDVRSARLRRFPYRLLFREAEGSIRIVACFHTRRDPRRWRTRR